MFSNRVSRLQLCCFTNTKQNLISEQTCEGNKGPGKIRIYTHMRIELAAPVFLITNLLCCENIAIPVSSNKPGGSLVAAWKTFSNAVRDFPLATYLIYTRPQKQWRSTVPARKTPGNREENRESNPHRTGQLKLRLSCSYFANASL